MSDTHTIETLKRYFERRDDVVMAFLFGSRAEGRARPASDWDIGVYLREENREKESSIWSDVIDITHSEVDMVVLNRAPATIAWGIIRKGDPLVIKDRKCYLDFMLRVSEEADAFYHTVREYYAVFERSASLSAEDRVRLTQILTFLEEEVKDYAKFKETTWEEYTHERGTKRQIERWAEQIINAIIDVAKTIVASERHKLPGTYKEIARELGSIAPFNTGNLMETLAVWTELRNILAHEYVELQWDKVSHFASETEPLLTEFILKVKEFTQLQETV